MSAAGVLRRLVGRNPTVCDTLDKFYIRISAQAASAEKYAAQYPRNRLCDTLHPGPKK
jgi:hypothetical protein